MNKQQREELARTELRRATEEVAVTIEFEYHKTTLKHAIDIPPVKDKSQVILSNQDLHRALTR